MSLEEIAEETPLVFAAWVAEMEGFGEKQWVYTHCDGCNVDVALAKLKVAVD